jgi:hypothetical protein
MNDPFGPSTPAPILAELAGQLRDAVLEVIAEPVSAAAVLRVAERARQLASSDSDVAAESALADRRNRTTAGGWSNEKAVLTSNPSGGQAFPSDDQTVFGKDVVCLVVEPADVRAASPSLFGYFSQVGPISYFVSALIMGFALVAAWQYQITTRLTRLEMVSGIQPKATPLPTTAGRVSAMVDCRLAVDGTSSKDAVGFHSVLAVDSHLESGRQIKLDSGAMEIVYRSGAKVILQGPATFKVDGNGGYLAVGRLTGKFNKAVQGSGDAASAQEASFIIRTPTAVVTDLGTEFGVEVDNGGCTTSYVFRGRVCLQSLLPGGHAGELVLKADEAGRVEPSDGQVASVRRVSVEPQRFVRRIGDRRIPIRVFSTGDGLAAGHADAHWEVVAAGDAAGDSMQQAVVVRSPCPNWHATDISTPTKWISRNSDSYLVETPGRVYTFRTAFELEDGVPGTAVLRGNILVDRRLLAVRLNGRDVPMPEQPRNPSQWFSPFSIAEGFVSGMNSLEFDVETSEPFAGSPLSALGLRVELNGSVQEMGPGE